MRVLFVSCVLVCSGCIFTSDPPPGTLEVRWTIGAGVQTCEEAGLDAVEISLEEEGGDLLGPFTTSCEAGRSGTYPLDDLDEGTYTVVIDALAGGERVYTGRSQGAYTVESDRTVRTERVVLSPIPASLDVLWRFEDGRQCGFHDVDDLVIQAFLNNAVAEEVTTTCAEGEALIEDVLPGTYDVQVTALDAFTLEPAYRFTEANVTVAAGDEAVVDGIFVACEDIADGCL
jgi:hypothetical protein